MNKIKIKVWDYQDAVHGGGAGHYSHEKDGIPYEVEAYCVGGETGIFAIFDNPVQDRLVCIATGDDGFWHIDHTMDPSWINRLIEMFQSYMAE